MRYKALAIDIDGTITDMDRRLSLIATEKLRMLDIPVVLATGNVLCYTKAASKLIGVCCRIIAENGGVISDGFDKEPIVLAQIHECEMAFNILSQQMVLERLDPGARKTEIVLRRGIDIKEAKVILDTSGLDVEIIDTHFAIHIKNKSTNKGTGLMRMAGLMGLEVTDFVAIGDSVNDVEMLKVAGFSIAVANADAHLKEIADHVTLAPYGDGTAEAIEYLLSKRMI